MSEKEAEWWMGFACKKCGAPMALQPERPIEGCRAFRGRLACNLSGLWGDRVLRTWNADDKNHKFKLTEYYRPKRTRLSGR